MKIDNVTHVVPTETEKKIKRNEVLFGKRIKQLKHIIADDSYIPKGSTDSYHEFIFSMWQALVTGRKITPKMESSITKIVKAYSKRLKENNDPKLRKQKLDYVDTAMSKIHMLKRRLYECKYTPGMSHYICPAVIPEELTKSIQNNTEIIFKALGCDVYARADYLLVENGKYYFLEMNTLPGMTSTSLVPKSVDATGMSFEELIKIIIELSL